MTPAKTEAVVQRLARRMVLLEVEVREIDAKWKLFFGKSAS